MPQVSWSANPRNEYWIDVLLGGQPTSVLIDTGMVDRQGQVGFSIDQADYDRIKQTGGFEYYVDRARLMANGQISVTESGSLDVQLISPQTLMPVGPIVHVYVYRGALGVPDRVGVAFFHLLKGCKVLWDLDNRSWCIEYP